MNPRKSFWYEGLKPPAKPMQALDMRPHAVIVDMDGTLADVEWRRGRLPDYDAFYIGVQDDPVIDHVAVTVNLISVTYKILVVSGRPERCRVPTVLWLEKHMINYTALFMRAEGDHRQDYIVKEEILDRDILPIWNPAMALDDRDQCVRLWRSRGIPCLQVAEGNF